MDSSSLHHLFEEQRKFFNKNLTHKFQYRKQSLERLANTIEKYEKEIMASLYKDLRKPEPEALIGEIYFVLDEIQFALKNLKTWMKPKKVKTPLILWKSKSYEVPCPLGVVLIISPWNYPFRLAISPLVGALAAGNCAILKVSEHTHHTSHLIAQIISEAFETTHVAVVQGDAREAIDLLENSFDHIFFTGSPQVGKHVAQTASQHLTPVTLELGGTNPCFVHKDAHLKSAVKRVAWSKFLNSGQTCLSPNFVWVHKDLLPEFLNQLKTILKTWFGQKPQKSSSLSRIINLSQWRRLQSHIKEQKLEYGGLCDEDTLFIEPTLILNPPWNSPLVQEEIFGPILPILEYTNFQEAFQLVKAQEAPLSAYLFSQDKSLQDQFIKELRCGSCVINDALLQANNLYLPFGGVKHSGWGAYHGRHTFDTFSHKKSVLKQLSLYDFQARFPPYNEKKMNFLKRVHKKWLF